MQTNRMEELYGKAVAVINEMIPEAWSKVYLFAEGDDEYESLFFYYVPVGRDEPFHSWEIPNHFSVDESLFKSQKVELYKCFEDLRAEFKQNKQEVWTNLTFILESTGRFKIDYSYEDLSERGPFENHVIWAYKTLGKKIGGHSGEKLLQQYLNDSE